MRAAWVATVINLDWPTSPTQSPTINEADLVTLIDQLSLAGMNAIIFQIRTECDALYSSPFEPWSYWLTGQQGTMPLPYFDPLEAAVREAHKRGLELHAWFNPFRAERQAGNYPLSPQHVVLNHPEWVISIGTLKILDPGKQAVREHNLRVIMDVVRRYDIDGIHFDDYFYPYPPNEMTASKPANDALDDATYSSEGRGIASKYDWRRDNINLLFRLLHDSVQAVKPHVKIGVSPFGIWKNGVPPGITGMDAYNTIFADGMAWLNDGSVDYLTPQLYWRIGGLQDYAKLVAWWSDSVHADGRHLYPGHAPYHILDGVANYNWAATEVLQQIRLDRQSGRSEGGVFFRARAGILDNRNGFLDSLTTGIYRFPSFPPVMTWKDTVRPRSPEQLHFGPIAAGEPAKLHWDQPPEASDGESPTRYAIYRFTSSTVDTSDVDNPANIVEVTGERTFLPPVPETGPTYYYGVTSLDRNANESPLSALLMIRVPSSPLLASPVDGALDQASTVVLRWYRVSDASSYRVQLAADPGFQSLIYDRDGILDTSQSIILIAAQQCLYWRILASNGAGTGSYGSPWSFVTGFPASPALVSPAHANTDVPLPVTFVWRRVPTASSYTLQVSRNSLFSPVLVDTSSGSDSTLTLAGLQPQQNHFWRVMAQNSIDLGPWSAANGFRTGILTNTGASHDVPTAFAMEQNFPNPFNPSTTIQFSIPVGSRVSLRVVDLLGRGIADLVAGDLEAGEHTVTWYPKDLPSGMYLCRLEAADLKAPGKLTVAVKKMLFIK